MKTNYSNSNITNESKFVHLYKFNFTKNFETLHGHTETIMVKLNYELLTILDNSQSYTMSNCSKAENQMTKNRMSSKTLIKLNYRCLPLSPTFVNNKWS